MPPVAEAQSLNHWAAREVLPPSSKSLQAPGRGRPGGLGEAAQLRTLHPVTQSGMSWHHRRLYRTQPNTLSRRSHLAPSPQPPPTPSPLAQPGSYFRGSKLLHPPVVKAGFLALGWRPATMPLGFWCLMVCTGHLRVSALAAARWGPSPSTGRPPDTLPSSPGCSA